jgi:hypothetical protein
MAPPWKYTDPASSSSLTLRSGGAAGRVTLEAHDPERGATVRVSVAGEAIPALARAAAEAAGAPCPVVLSPCDLPPSLPFRIALGDITLGRGGVLEVTGLHGTGSVSPAEVRAAAATLATLAERAEREAVRPAVPA